MVDIAKSLQVQPSEEIEFWEDEYEEDEHWASRIPKEFTIKLTNIGKEGEE